MENLASALTEQRNPRSEGLEKLSAQELVELFIEEEKFVQEALRKAAASLARGVEMVAGALRKEGRLFYVGAGTSGRLGVLDASEIPPTFGASPETVQGISGRRRERAPSSVEGAEDERGAGALAVDERGVTAADIVCGISASGRTPFVLGALAAAKKRGAQTILLTCNPARPRRRDRSRDRSGNRARDFDRVDALKGRHRHKNRAQYPQHRAQWSRSAGCAETDDRSRRFQREAS